MEKRYSLLKEALSRFSLEDTLKLETLDRQFKALERLHSSLKDKELFFKLVVVNALMSYQLQMKGENYWETFADFFSKGRTLKDFDEFLRLYNSRYLNSKLRRLKRVLNVVGELSREDFKGFCKNSEGLLEFLSERLNQPRDAKTLLFAVKMLLYACRVAGEEFKPAPFSLTVPLDVRLKKISPDLEFWKRLSREVGIPPLHLDVIVWTTMGDKSFIGRVEDRTLKEKLLRLKAVLQKLARGEG
jgi:DNA-(apurinic or apyrimidinic site) lyase